MDILRLNILVLNEDPSLLKTIEERLKEQGFTVSCAQDLSGAVELLEHETFDVIVTDATMPDDDGVKLFKKAGAYIPTVMLSGNIGTFSASDLDRAVCCFLEKADIHNRLAKAVWTAFKRFKIDCQLQRDSELAA